VVGFEVVDLFAEEERPEVFADEFDGVQRALGAGFVGGEPGRGWGKRGGLVGLCGCGWVELCDRAWVRVWRECGAYLPLNQTLSDAIA
jgi:hypothetical protein